MRPLKLAMVVVAAVAMLMMSAAPAMAWGRCCDRDDRGFFVPQQRFFVGDGDFDRDDFLVSNRIDRDDCGWVLIQFRGWVFVCDF